MGDRAVFTPPGCLTYMACICIQVLVLRLYVVALLSLDDGTPAFVIFAKHLGVSSWK